MATHRGKGPLFNDRGWRELRRKVIEMSAGSRVKVGVLAEAGGDKEHGDDGITLIELAAIHEYGSPAAGIPERSFIRRTFSEKHEELAKMQEKLVGAIVEGKMDVRRALEILGQWGAAEIKKTVKSGPHIPPPLEPSTVRRKGSDRPLVDTGLMINSVTHVVEMGPETGGD
jgi:hypothetical protein